MYITAQYTIPSTQRTPFQVEVNQYTPERSYEDGVTLILFHAVNLHKETYEVMLKYLLDEQVTKMNLRVKDAWCIDNPNSGRSAVLNHKLLESDAWRETWSVLEYAHAAYSFLSSSDIHGVDFRARKLTYIAHSGGGTAALVLAAMENPFPVTAYVLLDPGFHSPGIPIPQPVPQAFANFALNKRDSWSSRETAREELRKKSAYATWDPKVFESFVTHGLRDDGYGGVTLSCRKLHEVAYCRSLDRDILPTHSFQQRARADEAWMHFLFPGKDDLRGQADYARQFCMDTTKGMTRRSINFVNGTGHMFPQINPRETARLIAQAIASPTAPSSSNYRIPGSAKL